MKTKTKSVSTPKKPIKKIRKKSLSSSQKKFQKTLNKPALKTSDVKRVIKPVKERPSDIYKDIIENIHEGIFEVDLKGNFTFVNNEVCRATGFTKKKLTGMNSRPLTDKDDYKKVMQAYGTVYKTGIPFRGLGWHIIRKNGEKRYIEGSIYLRKDTSGKPIGFRVIAFDATERRKIEHSLNETELKFRTIFDHASDGLLLARATDRKFIEANEKICQMLGYSKEELLQLDISNIHPKESASFITEQFINLIKKEISVVYDLPIIKKDGTMFFADVAASTIDYGGTKCLLGIFRDVTERKRAEESLRKSETRFKNLFDNSPVGVFLLKDRKFTDVNPAFCEISGYSRKDIIGQPVQIGYKDTEEFDRVGKFIYEEVEKNGIGIANTRLKRKNGDLFDAMLYLSLVDAEDPSLGFQCILIDITERMQVEESLRYSEEKFALAFKRSPTAICITTLEEGRYIDANDSYLSNLGYKSEEIIGRTIFDINLWIDPSEPRAFINELLKTGSATNFELRVQDKQGNIHWGICSASIINISGKPHVLTQIIDITEQKLAKEKIRTEKQRFRGITQNMPGVIFQFYGKDNGEYGASYISEPMNEFAEILSKSELEKLDTVFPYLVSRLHEQDKEKFLTSIKEAVENVSRWNFEGRVFTKSGKMLWILATSIPTRLEDRVVFDGIIFNITDRKIAEEAALKEFNFSNTVLETLPGPYYMFDVEQARFFRWNRNMSIAAGYSDEELLHMTPFDLVPKSEHDIMIKAIEKILNEGTNISEFNVVSKDGSTTPYLLSGNLLNYEGKSYVVGMGIDITERKKMEEALRAEEERFRIITEQSSDIIILINREGKIIYENPSIEKILGYNFQDRQGQNAFENIHPDDLPLFLDLFKTLFKGEKSPIEKAEARIRHADGTWRIFEVVGGVLKMNNIIETVIANLRDITERKKAEENLRMEEQRFRSLVEYSLDIIILLNTKGVVTYINPMIEKALGYKVEERIGQYGLEHVHPDDLEPAINRFMILATDTNSPVLHAEMRVQHKDGSWRLFETVGSNLVKDNAVETIIIRQHDITERKRIEQSLRESEEKFRVLTESTPTAVMLYQNDKWIYANPAASEISGYSNEELLRLNFWDFVHPDDRQTTIERGQKRQKGESVPKRYTLRIIAKDGTVKWIDLSGATITIGGSPAGIISVMDITERKNAEEKLRHEEQLFRSVTEQSSDLITIVNPEAKIIYHNPAVEKVLGYKPEERFGRSGFDLVHPDDLEMVMDAYKTLFSDVNASVQKGELRYRHKDGSWLTFEVTASNLVERDVIEAAIVNMHDITERKEAEEALKISESNLKYAQEEAHVGSWEFDAVQQKPFWSEEMFRIVGRDPALGPMSLEDFVELVHPDERKRVYSDVAKCFTKNLPYYHEYRIFKPDNKIAFIESRGKAITDDKGNIVRIFGILQDITERKRAEEMLVLIRKAVESSGDAIGMSDPQGHHFYHNQAFDVLFEYTPEGLESVGGGPALYVNKDTAREVFDTIMKGGSWNGEVEMISKSGRIFPILLRADAIIDENGKIIGLIGVHTDITERKKAEETVISERDFSQSVINTMPGLFYMFDQNGLFIKWNKNFKDLSGYSDDELMRMTPFDLVLKSERKIGEEAFKQVFSGQFSHIEAHFLSKDGTTKPYLFTGTMLEYEGKPCAIGMAIDISDRVKAEEEIIRLNESLEQRVKERTAELEAFSYSVSHDLRAPLRTIHGFGQALQEDYGNQLKEEAKSYLGRIKRATETMSDLIEDMLKLSRISRTEMDLLPVNLSQIVQSIVDELRKSQPERRVEIKIADGLEDLADPRMMRIVFENLLNNAWKFTGKNDKAEIEFGQILKDNLKVYFIRDNGAGFDMEYAGKLFTPFQRYHNAEEYAGTGIGLAIVKRIIIRHGGRIWAESNVGEGTTIFFTLKE